MGTLMKEKKHGLAGRRSNAAKEKTANTTIQIRVMPETKALYSAIAEKSGLSLSGWLLLAAEEKAIKNNF